MKPSSRLSTGLFWCFPVWGTAVGALLGAGYGMLWGPPFAVFGALVGLVAGMVLGVTETAFMIFLVSRRSMMPQRPLRLVAEASFGDAVIACIPAIVLVVWRGLDNDQAFVVALLLIPTVLAVVTSVVSTIVVLVIWMATDSLPDEIERPQSALSGSSIVEST